MMLAYENGASENGASTIDWTSGVSAGAAAPWIAPVSNRQGKIRDSSLAALAGTSWMEGGVEAGNMPIWPNTSPVIVQTLSGVRQSKPAP